MMEKEGEAFQLFPVEVWELILEKLNTSIDILNAYKAYPELEQEGVLKSRTAIWCFEQIIPHLLLWLNKREALFCRQVCMRWSLAIDRFLENHTRVPSPDRDILKNTSNINFINSFSLTSSFNNYRRPSSTFLPKMVAHPPDRNPFIGRSVSIIYFMNRGGDDDFDFWTGALEMFRRFGEHIWFLHLHYFDAPRLRYHEMIRDSLALVPNLKGLAIQTDVNGGHTREEAAELLERCRDSMPLLNNLERMSVEGGPRPLLNLLLSRHSTQICKLFILHSFWRVEYFQMFPNLRDLCLRAVSSKEELTDMLLSLKAPKLRTLDLGDVKVKMNVIGDVLPFLRRFPLLHTLTVGLNNFNLSEAGREHCFPPSDSPIVSIKSLTIWVRRRDPDTSLLQQFPCLEYLRIHYDCFQEENPLWLEEGAISNPDIWEALPKLRGIVATTTSGFIPRTVRYSRTRYELRKMEQVILPHD